MLDRIDRINAEKRARALHFIDALAAYSELEFHRVDTSRHNYHLLAARVANGKRDAFIRSMYNKHGVKCVVQYLPLNRYDFYVKLGMGHADCANADAFYDNMVSFPFQHWLTDAEFDHMLAASKNVLEELRSS
jgi:dTDP-4-amino-4,6-dideoxygalactose transaminase